jgi:ribitol-5-phosphate 2-dehydrogenase (NADP+) / D-ribitol-5-phosphate cytidylyltransferase
MRTVAVVLAGGSGSRFGSARPKQFGVLRGRNLVEHCVLAFESAPDVDTVLVVTARGTEDEVRRLVAGYHKVAAVIPGGSIRSDSTRQAINWLTTAGGRAGPDGRGGPAGHAGPAGPDAKVLFHDAARPLVDQRTIADCLTALDKWDAVGVVVPSSDTIVEVDDGVIRRVLPRHSLARCQTPQGFRLSVISRAYQLAGADPAFDTIPATDDCGVVLRYLPEIPVAIVTGSERNLKITYAADLAVAEALLDADEAADQPEG